MVQSKIIARKRYWLYDEYYTHNEAYEKAEELKKKNKGKKPRFRWHIEEIEVLGTILTAFTPGRRHLLWTN